MFPTAHGIVSQGRKASSGGGPASPIPLATHFRLQAYETWGSSIADISELWLGSNASTRFASSVTTEKSTGGTVNGIVDGSLTDTTNSQSRGTGCWWQLQYASPEALAYAQVARPNSTATRRLRTWAIRLLSGTQWLTALARGDTDDMNAAATYAPFNLASAKILVTPLEGNTAGGAISDSAVAASASLGVNRPSDVDANDAILLAWGNVGSGSTECPITPPAGVVPIYAGGGLYIGLRITNDHATEAATYSAENADASRRSMAALARTLHNVDPSNPIGDVQVATASKTPPSVTVSPNQAILAVALYGTNETGITPPSGFTLIGNHGRAAGAGDLRVVAALRAAEDDGPYSPGDWGSTATPLRVVTAVLNASTP